MDIEVTIKAMLDIGGAIIRFVLALYLIYKANQHEIDISILQMRVDGLEKDIALNEEVDEDAAEEKE